MVKSWEKLSFKQLTGNVLLLPGDGYYCEWAETSFCCHYWNEESTLLCVQLLLVLKGVASQTGLILKGQTDYLIKPQTESMALLIKANTLGFDKVIETGLKCLLQPIDTIQLLPQEYNGILASLCSNKVYCNLEANEDYFLGGRHLTLTQAIEKAKEIEEKLKKPSAFDNSDIIAVIPAPKSAKVLNYVALIMDGASYEDALEALQIPQNEAFGVYLCYSKNSGRWLNQYE